MIYQEESNIQDGGMGHWPVGELVSKGNPVFLYQHLQERRKRRDEECKGVVKSEEEEDIRHEQD